MTSTLDAPAATAPAAQPVRRAMRARWLVAVRLARRQVRRTLISSALICTLILLPIATMTAYAVVATSTLATPQERITSELGHMQAWIAVKTAPGSGLRQAPNEPSFFGTGDPTGTGGALEDPTILLPAGTQAIEIVQGSVRVRTPDGITTMPATTGQVADAAFSGRYDMVDGRAPVNEHEALVTSATLARLGIAIGDDLVLAGDDSVFTVTGTLRAADIGSDVAAVFLPASVALDGETSWYLPDLVLDWGAVQDLNAEGVVALSKAVLLDPPDVSGTDADVVSDRYAASRMSILVMLGAAAVFSAYVVVMLAGAAFAVSARRQQRSLAVAASVGATPADLRRIVVLQGTALGLIGGIVGIALGVVAGSVIMGAVGDGSTRSFPGFHVPWELLLAIAVFAVAVGTASAALPARTVARSDTLSALRGARRPQHPPRAARPVWGSVLLVIGVALTLGCALLTIVVNRSDLPSESPLRVVGPVGIVVGPIIVQLGVLLSGRWLLWITARLASRVSLSARLASRDASANAARTVPAFAAIAATVFLGVFGLSSVSMQNASNARDWYYQAPIGSLSVSFMSTGIGEVPALTDAQREDAGAAAVELARTADASSVALVRAQVPWWESDALAEDGGDTVYAMALMPERFLIDTSQSYSSRGQDPNNPISVIAVDDLETALGTTLAPEQLQAYREGAAIAADPRYAVDGSITIAAWSRADAAGGQVPTNIWPETPEMPWAAPVWQRELPSITIPLPLQPTAIAISPQTAESLGLTVSPVRAIAGFDHDVALDVRDRTGLHADTLSSSEWTLSPSWEDGPPDSILWMIPVIVAISVLVLGASTVALGLARFERRPDDATLSAIGATRRMRRSIGFWEGLIIAGFGTAAGAVAGILPPIGIAMQSNGALFVSDAPWIVLLMLAIVLPLAIAVVSWCVPPRRPDLTRRTAIA